MDIDIRKYFWKLFFVSILYFQPSSLFSVATCTGTSCTQLPPNFLNQFNELELQFKFQYIDKINSLMGDAGAGANISSGMIGLGSLNRFQFGGGVAAAYKVQTPTSVVYQDVYIQKLPTAGFGLSPSVSAGVNLGWLFGHGPAHKDFSKMEEREDEDDDEEEEEDIPTGPTILNRFNLYVNGFNTKNHLNDFRGMRPDEFGFNGNVSLTQWGVNLRYMLVEPGKEFFLFRFMGLNFGGGFNHYRASVNVNHDGYSNTNIIVGPYVGNWIGQTKFDYEIRVKSIPFDIRTGINVLKIFTFFTGVGYVKHTIDTRFEIERKGPLKLSLDAKEAYISNLMTTTTFQDATAQERSLGFLETNTKSYYKNSFGHGYALFGMELSVFALQVYAEAFFAGGNKSGNLGVRLNF